MIKGETATYISCGCADTCWIAEIKYNKTSQVKAKLRCNSEKVLSSLKGEKEVVRYPNCKKFEDENKIKNIVEELKALVRTKP